MVITNTKITTYNRQLHNKRRFPRVSLQTGWQTSASYKIIRSWRSTFDGLD